MSNKTKKILITGINGFVGRHLVEYIVKTQKGAMIFGCDSQKLKIKNEKLKTTNKNLKLPQYFQLDIRNQQNVERIIKKVRPDIIFHLAAISASDKCEQDKKICDEVNVGGTKNLLKAMVQNCPHSTILIPSSSEVYKKSKGSMKPVKENAPLARKSYYAETKKNQEDLGLAFHQDFGLKTIIVRTFNILGKRGISDELDICTKIAKQISAAEKDQKQEKIWVERNNIRDFINIEDVVRAYWFAVNRCNPGEIYNICTGKGHKLGDILNKLKNLSKKNFKIKDYFEIIDNKSPTILIGNNSKFRKLTDWKPKIDIMNETLSEMLEYWRKPISNN